MKNILALLFIICFFVSCQKEFNPLEPSTQTQNSESLLRKVVNRNGVDSMITTFVYDNQKRLLSYTSLEVSTQGEYRVDIDLTRGLNGRFEMVRDITKFYMNGGDPDTTNYFYSYNVTGQVSHMISRYWSSFNGVYTRDSFTYRYTNNLLEGYTMYEWDATSNQYEAKERTAYTYNANSIIIKTYEIYLGQEGHYTTQTLTYDDRLYPYPVYVGYVVEEPYGSLFEPLPKHNLLSYNYINHYNSSENYQMNITHTYNAANKPTKSIFVSTGGSVGTESDEFFYQ